MFTTLPPQDVLIEIGETFLHQETDLTMSDIYKMSEFDKYYNARELFKSWQNLPKDKQDNKKLSLEVSGFFLD